MAERPNIAELFTPVDYDAALIWLRWIVGCSLDYVWTAGGQGQGGTGGSCDNTNDILALLITTLNWAMLSVIAVVATYLIFAALKDTANDGEAGGRSMNPSWTLVMAGIGAILCFPAFNGFNALQIGTMQVAVWSSGLGDSMWRHASTKMASAETVNTAFSSRGEGGWFYSDPASEKALREQIAVGLATRVAGEICRTAIAKGVASMATPEGGITTVSPPPTYASEDDGYTQTVLTYQAGKGLNESSGLCGAVSVTYASKKTTASQSGAGNAAPENVSAQNALADASARFEAAASKAGADALIASIQSEGDALYKTLFPNDGARLRGPSQLAAIETAVKNTIDRAKKAMQDAVSQAPNELKQHATSAMAGNQKNGWLYAILYQRVLVNATTALGKLGSGGVSVQNNKPAEELGKVFGCGGWFQTGCSNELEVFFGQYKKDTLALAELEPAFINAAMNSSTHGVNSVTVGGINAGGSSVLKWLNATLLDFADAEISTLSEWKDPIPQLQATGAKFLTYSSGILAMSAASAIPNPIAQLAGQLGKLAAPLGWFLFGIGFMLAVVVPYMPLLYFFTAAISWFVFVFQAIATAPIWLMQAFYPNQQGGISRTGIGRALMFLLGILLRPALIIVGLMFCMMLMRVGIGFLTVLSSNAFVVLSSSNSGFTGAFGDVALALGGPLIYTSAAVMLVSYCCRLIDGVPDMVMEGLESGFSRVMGGEKQHAETSLGNPTSAVAAGIAVGATRQGALAGTLGKLTDRRQRNDKGKNLAGTR